MRYNPCGRIVDMGRKPYRTDCRFFRDNDTVDQVRWYEARPDATTLDRPSIIYRREWDNDQYEPIPVGEVDGATKKFEQGFVPVGMAKDHVCGTDRDFDEGGEYDTDLPQVRYGALGWPECCAPPPALRGGPGIGGKSVYHVTSPYTRSGAASSGRSAFTVTRITYTRGGAGASGRSAYANNPGPKLYGGAAASGRAVWVSEPFVDPAAGGFMIGGEIPDTYTPGTPHPGTDCLSAGRIEFGVTYTHAFPPFPAEDWWFFVSGSPAPFHVTTTGVDGVNTTMVCEVTTDCFLIGINVPIVFGPPCWEFAVTGGLKTCLVFRRTSGATTYSFRIDPGPC